jgi:DNA-binding transcriptional LysR family regulator
VSLSQLDLNLLVVLETVLAERSVVRAARRLHVTPSAVSNSLARLRDALEDPLVLRQGRGIVPTPRAAALGPVLTQTLQEIDRAVYGYNFDPATTTRQFTLAIADAGQIVQVPRLAAELTRHMPRARLRVVGIDTLLSSGGLAGTEVDVALAALPNEGPGVRSIALYEEQSVLVARNKHPVLGYRVAKRDLSALRHVDVHVAPGHGYRELAAAYRRAGIERDIALVVPTFIAAASVVAATDYVATLPASLVQRFGASMKIGVVDASAPRVAVAVKLAWHERTEHDLAMIAFRELVIDVVKTSRKQLARERPLSAL